MNLYHLIVAALPGAVFGLIAGWQFVFNSLIPWLAVPSGWQNLLGLVLYVFFFGEVGAAIGMFVGLAIATIFALLFAERNEILAVLRPLGEKISKSVAGLLNRNKR